MKGRRSGGTSRRLTAVAEAGLRSKNQRCSSGGRRRRWLKNLWNSRGGGGVGGADRRPGHWKAREGVEEALLVLQTQQRHVRAGKPSISFVSLCYVFLLIFRGFS
jgi:hypothetical protein